MGWCLIARIDSGYKRFAHTIDVTAKRLNQRMKPQESLLSAFETTTANLLGP
jgi:hypothetical protein